MVALSRVWGWIANEPPCFFELEPDAALSDFYLGRFTFEVAVVQASQSSQGWAPFLDKFLYETSAFPNISDDDQVDSMTQVIANFGNAIAHARRNKRLHG
jgi:hypothetical protein